MDQKFKSRKLFVWIVITVIFIGCLIAEVFTFNERIFSDKAIIWLIGFEAVTTAIYLLGQTLIDFGKEMATKWIDNKIGKA